MFNKDFYPTPENVIFQMLEGYDVNGHTVLEPSAGKGDIVDILLSRGANVIACESNDDLRKIVSGKCKVIHSDFLKVQSSDISHVDIIVMNPPFSADAKHIIHAWQIAPIGCVIIALCNIETIKSRYCTNREHLGSIIEEYGNYKDLGQCFSNSERKTGVQVAMVRITKPGVKAKNEFAGFFMEEEPEKQETGIMQYNVIRDLVNRYVAAVKLYDKQLELGIEMNNLTSGFYSSQFGFSISEDGKPKARSDFKKDLQKSGWNFIFAKLNLAKYTTKGLKEDINKFVEEQAHIPFTMKNIYAMLHLVVGTNGQRMDKALMEVFDKLTKHYDENRYYVEGWKTNSYYLVNRRFIMPYCVHVGWGGKVERNTYSSSSFELIEDFVKALCFISGDNYSNMISLDDMISYKYKLVNENGHYLNELKYDFDVTVKERDLDAITRKQAERPGSRIVIDNIEFGKWFNWGYFKVRAYKKGTMHIEFLNEDLWAKFNQRIAKLKGYPLFEGNKKPGKAKKETKTYQEAA